ncbi:MAG: glycosyltransferase family 2 protein [Mariprofundaceae bacterium]|nr:glycosyltransferase family 2 protein [Mariprofundaceae bacterium]
MIALPKVTVVTPVYNAVTTIASCIQSVIEQDYTNIEHIIVDGGSTDGTLQVLESLNVKYVSEPDAGIYDAFNKGIERSTGDIINILNADDIYAFDSVVSLMVNYIHKNKLELCHAKIEQVDSNGGIISVVGKDIIKKSLLNKMRVAHPSVFVMREVYENLGKFSVGFRVAADHEFVLRVWDEIQIGFLPKVVVKMGWGGASNSQVLVSLRESMAASIMHGQPLLKAMIIYYVECIKNIHRIVRNDKS